MATTLHSHTAFPLVFAPARWYAFGFPDSSAWSHPNLGAVSVLIDSCKGPLSPRLQNLRYQRHLFGNGRVFPSAGEAALALRWKGFTLARLSAMEPAWMHALSGSMILISIGEIGNWFSIMDNAKAIPMN